MAWLGDLLVRLRAETADFQQDMGKAAYAAESSMRRIKNAANITVGGLTLGGIGLMIKGVIDAGDQLGKLSQKVGVTVEDLSKLQYAAELGNVDTQTFAKGMRDFNRSLIEAGDGSSKTAKLFQALGVDIRSGPTAAFRQFADAFAQLPEGELRTAAAMQILKKAGAEFIPVIAEGTKGLDAAAEQATKLGIVISTDFAKQADQFNNNMTALGQSSKALTLKLTEGAIPAFVEISAQVVKGAEKGEKWLAVFRELNKVMAATLAAGASELPKPYADAAEKLAERAFNPPKRSSGGKISPEVQAWMSGKPLAPVPDKTAPDPEAVRRALASNEAAEASLKKRQIAAIQSMEEKRKSVLDLTEEQIMMERVLGGTYDEFDSNTKVRLLNLAIEVDERKQLIDRVEKQYGAMQELQRVTEQLDAERTAMRDTDRLALDQMKFETELIGKNAIEQQQLTAMREIDIETRRRMLRVAEMLNDTEDGGYAATKQIMEAGEAQKRAVLEGLKTRVRVERDWLTGAKQGFNEYMDAATNAAEMARSLWVDAFRGMEDALINFVKTGKLDFKSLADSIISDLIRIQIRQSITVPLAQSLGGSGLMGSLGNLFGFGSVPTSVQTSGGSVSVAEAFSSGYTPMATGGNFFSGQPLLVGENGPELMVPRSAGSVIPNDQLGGGGISITQHINIDSRSDQATILQAIRAAADMAKAEILQDRRQGGRAFA